MEGGGGAYVSWLLKELGGGGGGFLLADCYCDNLPAARNNFNSQYRTISM